MCIWQCSCTLQIRGFTSSYLPLAFSCFSSLFPLSDPPFHLPSVTGHHLAGSPQVRAAAGKHSSQQHTPSKAKENPLPGRRCGERACATGVCAALPPMHVCTGPSCKFFCPVKNQEKHYQKLFSLQYQSDQSMRTLKCASPVYCMHLLNIMGDRALYRKCGQNGSL